MKSKAQYLNNTLTNLKFLLFIKVCLEYLGIISHLSKVMQYDDITIDGVTRKLKATIDRLHEMESTVPEKIMQLASEIGEELKYKEEQLHLPRGSKREQVISGVTKITKDLLSSTITALESRLSFSSNPVLSAASVFPPSTWPSDSSELARYGYTEIQQLTRHFEAPLKARNYEPEACLNEWAELKLQVQELLRMNPTLWQRILNESQTNPNLSNILALLRIILVIPVQTASLERGFSLMKRVKSDWRSCLQPKTLTQLMSIKLNGPSLKDFNPLHAIPQWWRVGPRRRRTSFRAAVSGRNSDSSNSDSSDSDSEYSS